MSWTSCVPRALHRTVSVHLLLWLAYRVSLVLNRASGSINLWEDISAQGWVCLLSANNIAELPPGEDVSMCAAGYKLLQHLIRCSSAIRYKCIHLILLGKLFTFQNKQRLQIKILQYMFIFKKISSLFKEKNIILVLIFVSKFKFILCNLVFPKNIIFGYKWEVTGNHISSMHENKIFFFFLHFILHITFNLIWV